MIKKIKSKYKKFTVILRLYNLNIPVMVAVFSILVFLGSTSYLYMQSPQTIAHRKKLEEYFKQENARQEYNRLYRYHGYPHSVIYEEGKIPYFYDKWGNKCRFIYPSKEDRLVIHHADFTIKDSEDGLKEENLVFSQKEDTENYENTTPDDNDRILLSHGIF